MFIVEWFCKLLRTKVGWNEVIYKTIKQRRKWSCYFYHELRVFGNENSHLTKHVCMKSPILRLLFIKMHVMQLFFRNVCLKKTYTENTVSEKNLLIQSAEVNGILYSCKKWEIYVAYERLIFQLNVRLLSDFSIGLTVDRARYLVSLQSAIYDTYTDQQFCSTYGSQESWSWDCKSEWREKRGVKISSVCVKSNNKS